VSHTGPGTGRPLKVLHVDDDPMNLRVVQEIMTAFGHRAVGVSSGAEALRRLGDEAFDLLLLDIHMPQMDGVETLQRLRSGDGRNRSIPTIAVTADIISRRPQEYVALGFDDFISKPIPVAGLMAAIERVTGSQPLPARRVS
jgi:CheY-like chemotaxis protein